MDWSNPLTGQLLDPIGEIEMNGYTIPIIPVPRELLSLGVRETVEAYAIAAFLAPPNGKRVPAEYMIDKAIKTGKVKRGDILVEPTSGGMGAAMALCAPKYDLEFRAIVSDNMPDGKIRPQVHLGATIVRQSEALKMVDLTASPGTMRLAELYAEKVGGVFLNQYHSKWNPESWAVQVAPQVHEIIGNRLTEAFFGLGSTGTMRGLGGALKKLNPDLKIIGTYPYFKSEIAGLRDPERLKEVAKWKHVPDFHEPINRRTAQRYSLELFKGGIPAGESGGAVFGECDNYYSNLAERGKLNFKHVAIMPFMDTFLPYGID